MNYLSLSASIATISLIGLIGLTGCENIHDQSTNAPIDIASRTNLVLPTYTVAMDADYPPYDFRDESGTPVGFDVDILKAIGENQGFKVDIKPLGWSTLLESLQNNDYDLAVGGIAESDVEDEKYRNVYAISHYYFYGNNAIATKAGVNHINSFNDLKNRKVAMLENSAYIDYLNELYDDKESDNILPMATTFIAYKALFNGKAEAVLADKGVLDYYKLTKPEYHINISGEGKYFAKPYGMVFLVKKDHPQLLEQINQGIEAIVADGTYTQIHQKWFNKDPQMLPTSEIIHALAPNAASAVNINK